MPGSIFISYRRDDDPGTAGRLFDSLRRNFRLFMDVDNIQPGQSFATELHDRLKECDVLLAVIGSRWIHALDAKGNRRLDDPNDFVRSEIEAAIRQNKLVIPVLVGGTEIPSRDRLPESLHPLIERQAVRVTHERFASDAKRLTKALKKLLQDQAGQNPEPSHENTSDRESIRKSLKALKAHITTELQEQKASGLAISATDLQEARPGNVAKLSRIVSELEEHGYGSSSRSFEPEEATSKLNHILAALERVLNEPALPPPEMPSHADRGDEAKFTELLSTVEEQIEEILQEQYGVVRPK